MRSPRRRARPRSSATTSSSCSKSSARRITPVSIPEARACAATREVAVNPGRVARHGLDAYADEHSDAGKMAGAIGYLVNQRKPLRRFLEEGRVPIHNNSCELAIRPDRDRPPQLALRRQPAWWPGGGDRLHPDRELPPGEAGCRRLPRGRHGPRSDAPRESSRRVAAGELGGNHAGGDARAAAGRTRPRVACSRRPRSA